MGAMSVAYLIDGYNLIHALGMIRKNAGPGGLEASRTQLLQYLAQAFGENASRVTIIFDAKQAPRLATREQQAHGMTLCFAPKGQTADDVIETLIDSHASPKTLVVVSNDMRLQRAAQRRGAQAWTHEMLLDFFDKAKDSPVESPNIPAEKNETLSAEEAKHWQSKFADLQNDPELKEFFDHDQFD
jgi:uncharacterized protein